MLDQQTVLNIGVTYTDIEDKHGARSHAWVPYTVVNFSIRHTLELLPQLTFGLSGKWQSKTAKVESYTGYTVTQDSYAKLNLFTVWDLSDNATLRLNVDNLTNEKYISSLWEIGYYGAPSRIPAEL